RSEAHLRLRRDELLDLRGALLDGVALGRRDDVLVAVARREREHAREGGRERVDLTAARWQLDRAALAVERALSRAKTVAERAGALAHDRVLEEPRAELFFRLALRDGQRLERWQQAARLQEHEARREREERRDLLRRQRLERAHAREVRVSAVGEAYGADVEAFLLDELAEKVERAVDPLDRDARRLRLHHASPSRPARASARSWRSPAATSAWSAPRARRMRAVSFACRSSAPAAPR